MDFWKKIEEGEKLDFGGCIEGMEELRLDLYLEVMHWDWFFEAWKLKNLKRKTTKTDLCMKHEFGLWENMLERCE